MPNMNLNRTEAQGSAMTLWRVIKDDNEAHCLVDLNPPSAAHAQEELSGTAVMFLNGERCALQSFDRTDELIRLSSDWRRDLLTQGAMR
jgi:hypothetical protein